ncbi:DUF433 domain-containing protein [Streptomyces phaeochromogenes]|uniref:DUF433 domain-containing protein n=1 Tax=Streptomyces phaeochromogenes TaxID=1923 RepID=UPI0039A3C3EC
MKYLHSDPDILDGSVVVKGTRVPIDVILYRIQDRYSIDEIQEIYSWVSPRMLHGAISEAFSEALGAITGRVANVV